ncbi:hypothetical protein [Streptomyces sp. NRRL F-5123]|uniref:hypothetical protein n=1 Tax=Streptomyces sp. NRRL F-5123 TaxID=1463856 RepID=UPI0004E1A12E|nr:hypothetical protein [Streptomyces sp. NRRL F-5123]
MSEVTRPEDTPGVPPEHDRIAGPASIRGQAAYFDERAKADVEAQVAARDHHEGLSARIQESAGEIHAMVDGVRHDDTRMPTRADLRPVANALARHFEATEKTARQALDERHAAADVVREDREEGERLQRNLDDLLTREQPEDTFNVSASGVLGEIDLYMAHERRDLIPAIDRELSPTLSARLARSFAV